MNNDDFMPRRFRIQAQDTRAFYQKPEWWMAFEKWGITLVVLAILLGVAGTFAWKRYSKYRHEQDVAAQEARLKEIEEAKVRTEKARIEKAEREAREKAKAEAAAEKERLRQERLAAEAQRQEEAATKKQALANREKGPRRVSDLDEALATAGVRWWGSKTPPKFATDSHIAGKAYWCVFPDDRRELLVRVTAGEGEASEPTIEVADNLGFLSKFEAELLERRVATEPHLVMMDHAAWVRVPESMVTAAAHVTVPDRLTFRPAETLMGSKIYSILRSRFRSKDRLNELICEVEYHWRNEERAPIKWQLGFEELLPYSKLYNAIEDQLQAELDAKNGVSREKNGATDSAPAAPQKKRSSLTMNSSPLAGRNNNGGRKLGENRTGFGGSGANDSSANEREPQKQYRVSNEDVKRALLEGYLSCKMKEA